MKMFRLNKLDLLGGKITPEHAPQVGDFYKDSAGGLCRISKLHGDGSRIDWDLLMTSGRSDVEVTDMPAAYMRSGGKLIPLREPKDG
tara:strand:+ start:334 stop:594 length:261 start_codon:yes stop_codon:yes gene_type:complete